MIEITVNPVIFNLGPWEVKWVDIAAIVSFITVSLIFLHEARRHHLPGLSQHSGWLTALFLIGALAGGKLFYVFDRWDYVLSHPLILLSDLLRVYGVLIGGLAGVLIYIKLHKLPFWRYADSIAPGAMLGLALYRIGCILDGCCEGTPSGLPFSVVYTDPATWAPFGKLLYFTQAYMLILGLAVFFVLWYLRDKLRPDGTLFLLWLILYVVTDQIVRPFRFAHPFIPGLQQAQLIGILLLLVTVPLLIIRVRSAKPSS
jgi:phosphatidylglycerol:prolipoprotein diacylglycerol transferase